MPDSWLDATAVRPLDGFTVAVLFENDELRVLDLEPWLQGPTFARLRERPGLFRCVFVEHGTLAWPGGLDIAPEHLYSDSERASHDARLALERLSVTELSREQLAWLPDDPRQAYGQWPCGTKVEFSDGIVFSNDAGDAAWDWRSVALAARAYPGWQVELLSAGLLRVSAPLGGVRTSVRP